MHRLTILKALTLYTICLDDPTEHFTITESTNMSIDKFNENVKTVAMTRSEKKTLLFRHPGTRYRRRQVQQGRRPHRPLLHLPVPAAAARQPQVHLRPGGRVRRVPQLQVERGAGDSRG